MGVPCTLGHWGQQLCTTVPASLHRLHLLLLGAQGILHAEQRVHGRVSPWPLLLRPWALPLQHLLCLQHLGLDAALRHAGSGSSCAGSFRVRRLARPYTTRRVASGPRRVPSASDAAATARAAAGPFGSNAGGHRFTCMDLADFTRGRPAIIMQQMQAHLRYAVRSEREKQELQAWLAAQVL